MTVFSPRRNVCFLRCTFVECSVKSTQNQNRDYFLAIGCVKGRCRLNLDIHKMSHPTPMTLLFELSALFSIKNNIFVLDSW